MVSGRNSRGNGGGLGGPVPIIGQPKEFEQRLKLQHLKTPNAFPVSQIVPEPDGAKVMMFGGLTKLEWMAGQVAAGNDWDAKVSEGYVLPEGYVYVIVDRAAAILEECEARTRRIDTEVVSDGEVLT